MNAQPISEKKPLSLAGRIGLAVLGIALAIGGLLGFWFLTLGPSINVFRARSWPTANCTVISSRVEEHEDDDGSSWSAEISFEYQIDNQSWRSDSWSFFSPRGKHKTAQDVVRRYPVGKQTLCYYDPADPRNAVLDRSFYWWSLFGSFFLLMTMFGLLLMAGSVKRQAATSAGRGGQQAGRGFSTAETTYEKIFDRAWEGPQRLKPEASRMGRVIGMAFFALIWNGIVSIPVYLMLSGKGGIDWCFALFLIPFVGVGLLLIYGIVYQILALTNPVVEIALSNGLAVPGETLEVAWETHGRTSRLRSLFIAIDGSEQARYTRGTDTYTDESSFCLITVASVEDPTEIQFGSCSVTIPDNALPSFDATNNKVIWSIKILGDIPFWPNVTENFSFRVKPS